MIEIGYSRPDSVARRDQHSRHWRELLEDPPTKKPGPQERPTRRRSLAEKARAFLVAVTGPQVPEAVYQQRLKLCLINECGHLRRVGEDAYCGACGCPKWRLAELRSKLRYARLECPCQPPVWAAYESEAP